MLDKQYIAQLGGWQGFEVVLIERRLGEQGEADEIWIDLFRV